MNENDKRVETHKVAKCPFCLVFSHSFSDLHFCLANCQGSNDSLLVQCFVEVLSTRHLQDHLLIARPCCENRVLHPLSRMKDQHEPSDRLISARCETIHHLSTNTVSNYPPHLAKGWNTCLFPPEEVVFAFK